MGHIFNRENQDFFAVIGGSEKVESCTHLESATQQGTDKYFLGRKSQPGRHFFP